LIKSGTEKIPCRSLSFIPSQVFCEASLQFFSYKLFAKIALPFCIPPHYCIFEKKTMNEIKILGIRLRQQSESTLQLQNILTKHGCVIKTRLGLNDTDGNEGIIILELTGSDTEIKSLENELNKISGLKHAAMNL
jgi:hypothetical protein